MTIQDIAVSQTMKKKLLKSIKDDAILFVEENGDIIVNVAAYQTLKDYKSTTVIEDIVGEDILDNSAEFFVFS